MRLYTKEAARDLLYPMNKKDITEIYKMALNYESKKYTVEHSFRIGRVIPRGLISPCRTYGDITGLHLRKNDRTKYFDVAISTVFISQSAFCSRFKFPTQNKLFHKRKHFLKTPELIIADADPISLPVPRMFATITIKRMIIKLGSVKTLPIFHLFDFPYFH